MNQQALNRVWHRDLYGIMQIGHRWNRRATIAEVLHFETCNAAGPFSAVNCQVPPHVPVWQYVDSDDRIRASRSQKVAA